MWSIRPSKNRVYFVVWISSAIICENRICFTRRRHYAANTERCSGLFKNLPVMFHLSIHCITDTHTTSLRKAGTVFRWWPDIVSRFECSVSFGSLYVILSLIHNCRAYFIWYMLSHYWSISEENTLVIVAHYKFSSSTKRWFTESRLSHFVFSVSNIWMYMKRSLWL